MWEPLPTAVNLIVPGRGILSASEWGREKGEVFSVTIPAEEAYGPVHEEYRFTVDPSRFPSGIEPAVGQRLHLSSDQGELEAVVAAVEEDGVLLDANHPLAGQDLTFALTIVDVR